MSADVLNQDIILGIGLLIGLNESEGWNSSGNQFAVYVCST